VSGVHVRLRVGSEAYAFAVEHVLEVTDLGAIAPVPGARADVVGVRNLRGEVLPVFDLASLFGIESDGDARRMVVLEHESRRAGFVIDDVVGVGELAVPDEATESRFLRGAALDEGELVGVVDVPSLFEGLAQAQT
jgi:purine-binding chemotaxis protein CheW